MQIINSTHHSSGCPYNHSSIHYTPGTRKARHLHEHAGSYHEHTDTNKEEEEEMRSPGRAHPLAIPVVPAGPHRSGPAIDEGTLTAGPVRFSIMAVALLFISSPWTPDPRNTPTVCSVYHSGALEGGRGSSGSAATPPPGGGDAVTQVWALSPPGTTEGQRLDGGSRAWSVA